MSGLRRTSAFTNHILKHSDSPGQGILKHPVVTAKNSKYGDGVKFEIYDNNENENPVGTVFATVEKSTLAFNDGDDMQIEAKEGELVVRASTIGAKKLSEGIILTIAPEPDFGTR